MNDSISASAWSALQQQADSLLRSGFFPKAIDTSEKAIVIKMYGDLLGIPWVAAMNTINVIQGKPTISPQLMIGLAQRSKLLENMSIEDDGTTCTVTVKRVGQSAHTESFGVADAALMKTTEWTNGSKREISLGEKSNWKQQPKTMRKWRAIAAAFRVVFPDLLLGFYTPDEMGADLAINDEGDMQIIAPPIAVDPNAESKRIASEWAARWKADGATGADMQAALGVKRLGEFDWLADGAIEKADGLMESYAIDHEDEKLGIEEEKADSDNAPKAPTAAETIEDAPVLEAPKKVLTDSEIARPWAAEWYDRGASFEDILAALKIDRLGKFDWKADGAIAKADALMKAYKAAKAEAKKAQKPSTPIGKAKTTAPGIGDSSAEPPYTENELDKAIARLPKYDKNTDASRL